MNAKAKWELSSRHDWPAYARLFADSRRIHIPDLLARGDAEAAYHALAEATAWNTVINAGAKVIDLTDDIKASLSAEQAEALDRSVVVSASQGYQFKFDNYRLSEQGEPHRDKAHPLAPMVDFLNSPRFLAAMRQLTGRPDIAFADAQATRYGPGQFLHVHDDLDPGKKRIAAYVLNLTPEWSAEWGGILHFMDSDGHVAEGYVPRFNALNVFEVGVRHFVSFVAPYARAPRLSVTGWLRGR
jgi:Rps23 Pro-64 3,4-dihydroxylase Tpa1-like proline 4-hydroxylase